MQTTSLQTHRYFLACVAGAPPLFPFLPIPYPLSLSTPATQASISGRRFSQNDENDETAETTKRQGMRKPRGGVRNGWAKSDRRKYSKTGKIKQQEVK